MSGLPAEELANDEGTRNVMERMETMAPGTAPRASRSLSLVRDGAETTHSAASVRSGGRGAYARVVKPTIDRLVACCVLLVMAVPMALIALAVARSVGRPVIFRQQRVGRDGKLFDVYKFRTMHHSRRQRAVQVQEDRRLTHKSEVDPRLTGVGRFLRKWSLDELPQLFNVLKGDMSIVGPRPELPAIVEKYPDELHVRHTVKPGLTGLWQVSARGEGLMHENGAWDIEYANTISFWTDLKIVAKTPAAMFSDQRGF